MTQAGDRLCFALSVYFGEEMHLTRTVQILKSKIGLWLPCDEIEPFSLVLTAGLQLFSPEAKLQAGSGILTGDSVEPEPGWAPAVHS